MLSEPSKFMVLLAVCGLFVILVSSLFWSLTACTMFGRSNDPISLPCVGTPPLMGGSGEFSVVVPQWSEDRVCVSSGDAVIASFLFKPDLAVVLPALSSQFEESHAMFKRPLVVSHDGALFGSCVFTGWYVISLLHTFSPGWCFPGVLSGPLRGGPAMKESSPNKEVYLACRSKRSWPQHVHGVRLRFSSTRS